MVLHLVDQNISEKPGSRELETSPQLLAPRPGPRSQGRAEAGGEAWAGGPAARGGPAGRRAAGGGRSVGGSGPVHLAPGPAVGGRCLLPGGWGRCDQAAGGAASSGTAGGAAGRAAGAARAGAASGAADGESGRGRRRRLLVGPGTAGRGLCVRRRWRWCSGPAEPGKRGRAEGCPWPRPDPPPGPSLVLAGLPPAGSPGPDPSFPAARRPRPVPPPIPSIPSGPAPRPPSGGAPGDPPPFEEGPRCSVAPRLEHPRPIQRPSSWIRPSRGETAAPRDCWGAFSEVTSLPPSHPPTQAFRCPDLMCGHQGPGDA